MSDAEKLASLQLLLFPTDTPPVLSDELLREMKDDAEPGGADEAQYYEILEEKSRRLQNRASGVLKSLGFQAEAHINPLFAALRHYQRNGGNITKSAPIAFLEPSERAAVGQDDVFRPALYKVLLFQRIAQAIKSGGINLLHSLKYRPLDGYMIGADQWRRDRDQLLAQAGMGDFSNPAQALKVLENALAQQFLKTNDHVADGSNTHVKRMPSGHLRLNTPKQDDVDATALTRYFPQRHFVPLTEILGTVNGATGFSDSLTHLRQQYARPVARAVLFAGVIGMGCGIGLRKMARISATINEDALEHATNWHFSHENILAANDQIIAFMDGLDLPEISPQYRSDPYGQRRAEIRSDGGVHQRQPILQIFRQGPGRQRLHLHRRPKFSMVFNGVQRRRARKRLCDRWADAQRRRQVGRALDRHPRLLRGDLRDRSPPRDLLRAPHQDPETANSVRIPVHAPGDA